MLSVSCKAAIKAVIYLGSKLETGEKSSILQVAEFIGENEHTVGKLLQKLVKEDLIHSAKGPSGGFYMSAKQGKRKVIRIIEAIDGKEVFRQCGLGLSKCSETRPCPFHNEYKVIRNGFEEMCSNKKICDLYENLNHGLSYLIA